MKTAFTLFIICLFSYSSFAQPGTLDNNFGVNGKVQSNAGFQNYLYPAKALLQSDDKIIVSGGYQLTNNPDPLGFFAARYTANGILDTTFGVKGKKLISSQGYSVHATSAAIQKDNKIVIAGYIWSWFPKMYIGIIIRLNANGSLDTSFGADKNGILLQTKTSYFGALAVQSDNKIIALSARNDSNFINRFLPNGTLDSTLGKNGFVSINQYKSFFTCTLQTDRKFILSGYYYPQGGAFRKICLQRFLPNGSVDKSFGNSGTVITQYNDDALIYDVALQSDGKIVATGETSIYSSIKTNFATIRYNQNGSIDSSFGIDGTVTTVFRTASSSNSVIIQNNNDIVIGGYTATNNKSDFAVVKLNPDGKPDSTFGRNSHVITNFNSPAIISTLLLQKDEKIIACGNSQNYYTPNITLARYNNNEANAFVLNQTINNDMRLPSFNKAFIYPNPAQNVLRVAGLSSNKTKLTVIDFMGNVKLQTLANTSSYNLNIATLKPGNYLLKIEMNDAVVTKKFVKE